MKWIECTYLNKTWSTKIYTQKTIFKNILNIHKIDTCFVGCQVLYVFFLTSFKKKSVHTDFLTKHYDLKNQQNTSVLTTLVQALNFSGYECFEAHIMHAATPGVMVSRSQFLHAATLRGRCFPIPISALVGHTIQSSPWIP